MRPTAIARRGGVGFAGAAEANIIYDAPDGNREVLAAFLRAGGAPHASDAVPRWRFKPIKGASVVFESAPAAANHLSEVPHLRIDPLEVGATGFRRFRLWL